MDDQNKNLLLATALSFVVILVWFLVFPPPEAPLLPEPATVADSNTPVTAAPEATATAVPDTAPAALAAAARVTIDTPRLQGSLSLLGGRIDDIRLKDFRETLTPDAPIVTVMRPQGQDDAYYALYGWAAGNGVEPGDVPGPTTLWSAPTDAILTPAAPVTLTWDNGKGLIFTRTLAVDADFMITVTQSVTNTGAAAASLAPFGLLVRHGEPDDLKKFFILHEGVVAMADGTLSEEKYATIADYDFNPREGTPAEVTQVTSSGWIGFTDHYWMSTLIPAPGSAFKSVIKHDPMRDIYQTETVLPTRAVAPGATDTVTSRLFVGAKEWETIRAYQNDGGIDGFLDSIDWGWFFFLTKPIFATLHWLNAGLAGLGIAGSMGWAIIGLTLILKALVFPLAYKSYASMARMKELQPEMEKIKERAGEDKQRLQKEMMDLYKKEKVNPAAGCLPILIQIPIFFSLYKVIFVTLELRHAPWIGWIRDLSAPDPSSILNLFGLLPYATPGPDSIFFILSLGVLPIILGVSMWLQQKLNPAPPDPMQAQIFAWMPWVFMFMLGTFASGLIVYWIVNNLITFSQQYLIMRSHGYKPDVFGNILSGFRKKPATPPTGKGK